jgi:hypothetical protein
LTATRSASFSPSSSASSSATFAVASSLRVTGAGFFPMLTDVEMVVTGSSS